MCSTVRHSPQAKRAYAFLVSRERSGEGFTAEEFRDSSGWADSTTEMYLSKKLANYVIEKNGKYHSTGVSAMTLDAFCRMFSQVAEIARDPERPMLPKRAESLVEKARGAALAAIQHYNNPTATFRSGSFVVLMVIAFTSLFHAIFERNGVDYTDKRRSGQGEVYLWDMVKSARHYFGGETPVVKNLEIMRDLRDKLEHRFLPALDPALAGHCQAMVMNFERLLRDEFTLYYSLRSSLGLALQLSAERSPETVAALRRFQGAEYDELRQHLDEFQRNLPDEVLSSLEYCFRVWLIPKTANRASSADLAIEFVAIDNSDLREDIERAIVAIKTRIQIVDASEACNLWESEVIDLVVSAIGPEVRVGSEVRPISGWMVRNARDRLGIRSPSQYYYRANKKGDRPRYSQAFVDLLVDEYGKNPELFSPGPDSDGRLTSGST